MEVVTGEHTHAFFVPLMIFSLAIFFFYYDSLIT